MATKTQPPTAADAGPSGWQYAVRIFAGCVIVWFVLGRIHHPNPLWALISVIIVTEPEPSAALAAFRSRIVNTLAGCVVGLCFLYLLGPSFWSILLGIISSVVVCTSLIRVPGSWRVAAVTVAIVMTPVAFGGGAPNAGIATAIERTEEVLLGCGVALLLTLAANRIQHQVSKHVL